jgi:hypothetical protein
VEEATANRPSHSRGGHQPVPFDISRSEKPRRLPFQLKEMIVMHAFSRAGLDPVLAFLERQRPMFSLGSLVMYALALASELPVLIARLFLGTLAAIVVLELEGHPNGQPVPLMLALVPTAWSMLALLTPLGSGWWWRTRAGGRQPSTRETAVYEDALDLLQAHTTRPLVRPASWFVLDTPQPDAGVCGNSLMLSRGLLESEDLPAVLAHELGHLATPDGRLTAALNRLVILSSSLHPADEEHQPRTRRKRSAATGTPRRPRPHLVRDPRRRPRARENRVLRPRRTRATHHRPCPRALLARTQVHRRPVRREPWTGR